MENWDFLSKNLMEVRERTMQIFPKKWHLSWNCREIREDRTRKIYRSSFKGQKVLVASQQSRMYGVTPCDFSWGLHVVVSEEDKREVTGEINEGETVWHLILRQMGDHWSISWEEENTFPPKVSESFLIVENRNNNYFLNIPQHLAQYYVPKKMLTMLI